MAPRSEVQVSPVNIHDWINEPGTLIVPQPVRVNYPFSMRVGDTVKPTADAKKGDNP